MNLIKGRERKKLKVKIEAAEYQEKKFGLCEAEKLRLEDLKKELNKKVMSKKQKVYQYSASGYFVTEYPSVEEAAKAMQVDEVSIQRSIDREIKTTKNYQFSAEKVDKMPAVKYVKDRMLGIHEQQDKRIKNSEYIDKGIIEDKNNRYFGKRKVQIGKMDIYANPNTPIDVLVEKYSKSL